jgi:hypothetical protein
VTNHIQDAWWSSVGCDSFRDETYEDVKTTGNNLWGTYHRGTNIQGHNCFAIRFFLGMVYLKPKHKIMLYADITWWYIYVCIETQAHNNLKSTLPLAFILPSSHPLLYRAIPLFTYLENQLLLLVV